MSTSNIPRKPIWCEIERIPPGRAVAATYTAIILGATVVVFTIVAAWSVGGVISDTIERYRWTAHALASIFFW